MSDLKVSTIGSTRGFQAHPVTDAWSGVLQLVDYHQSVEHTGLLDDLRLMQSDIKESS